MSLNRKFLPCAVAALTLLMGASSALAKTRAVHTTRISGVVVTINAKRHTLKLRVAHASKLRKASARAASAGGSSTIVVAFGDATVKGPDGAVAVGDDVTVTTNGATGHNAVAASINVVGEANGGDAGKGAAVPGEVTAVDPTDGTLTLAVDSTDAQGQSQASSLIVNVSATTILAVGDTNGNGHITLADVSVGDHVVVFTQDATANPVAAVGILDSTHAGGDHSSGDQPPTSPTSIPGTVMAVNPTALTLSLAVSGGPLAGKTIIVDATSTTSFGGVSGGADPFSLSDIKVDDSVMVYTPNPTATPIIAVGIVDKTTTGGAAPSTTPVYDAFNGTVASKGTASLVVTVTVTGDGPLSGQTVTVNVDGNTKYKGTTTDGTSFTLDDVQVGDAVRLYTTSLDPQSLLAAFIGDGTPGAGGSSPPSSPTTPPSSPPAGGNPPVRFGSVVTAVRVDGLTVTVLNGPLSGHSVIVSVPTTASFQADPLTGAGNVLATISVGDAVEIYTHSESASPIVAVGVVDDGVYTAS